MSKNNIINLIVGPIMTNCWIYPISENEAAVVDPGDEPEEIISALKKSNLKPAYILLTHGHFDHIAAVPQLAFAFSPRPQIAIHRLDSQYLGKEALKAHTQSIKAAMGSTAFLNIFLNSMTENSQQAPEPDFLLEEGSTIGPFTVLHVPGHTQGSVAFWDKAIGVLFTGDTLFKGNYGRTDLPGGNEKQLFTSLKRLLAMEPDITVYPGHGDTTTIAKEKALLFD